MPDELKHIKSIPGHPRPTDIFKPHLLSVELFSDMDELFRNAREIASGEKDDDATRAWKKAEGQHAVAIVTPGRLIMFDPCPEPNSMPEEKVAPMRKMMPPDPPLKISAISYTFIEALSTEIDKAIPFRGFLNAWAYLGHSVLVFEGHPSAFEAGVRDCDHLLVDSGMMPFMPLNWIDVASSVMKDDGKILIHDRETYTLSQVTKPDAAQSKVRSEAQYVELLLRLLMRASRSSIEITSGTMVPDLNELITDTADRDWLLKSFSIDPEKISADTIIDTLLNRAGWRWYTPFKTSGVLRSPVRMANGSTRDWNFKLTLRKDSSGTRRLEIER